MTDIFQNTILCANCNVKMNRVQINKNGFVLRSVICPKCGERIIHPSDEQEYKDFTELKKKEFNVKMRFVGNSYAVSIPKEIVTFMHDQEKIMNEMVRLSLEEFGRISLCFGNQNQPQHQTPAQVQKEKVIEIEKEKLKREKYH
jgi:hypothetical protein